MRTPRGEYIVIVRKNSEIIRYGKLTSNVNEWLHDNVGPIALAVDDATASNPWRWRLWSMNSKYIRYSFFFYNRKDALLFKTRWAQ